MDSRILHPLPIGGNTVINFGSKGIITLPILILCFTILTIVLGSVSFFMNSKQTVGREWDALQAKNNAEAGIWLGLDDWLQEPNEFQDRLYSLPSGNAVVKIVSVDPLSIRIHSTGRTFADGKDGIEAVYNFNSKQFVHWDHALN